MNDFGAKDAPSVCPSGHPVRIDAQFCSTCGQSTTVQQSSANARGSRDPNRRVDVRRRLWLLAVPAVAAMAILTTWLVLRDGADTSRGREASSSASPTATALGPDEKCQLAVMEIVAAGLDDQLRNDGDNSGLREMTFKYGSGDPVFTAATERVLPKAWLSAPTQGLDEALLVAQGEAFIVCAEPAVSGVTAPDPVEESEAAPTVPPSADEEANVDCADLDATACAEAVALVDVCSADPASIRRRGARTLGLTRWSIDASGESVVGLTSGDYKAGGFVLSCGRPANGVDVHAVYDDIERQALGWLEQIPAIVCRSDQPLDEASVGTVVPCDVWDESGFPNQAEIEVIASEPRFRVTLGFGD